jgi:hypothetical protein
MPIEEIGPTMQELANAVRICKKQEEMLKIFLNEATYWLTQPLPDAYKRATYEFAVSLKDSIDATQDNIKFYDKQLKELLEIQKLWRMPPGERGG